MRIVSAVCGRVCRARLRDFSRRLSSRQTIRISFSSGVGTASPKTNCDTCPLFFFFQAEDGIRDLIVTGVQTCALPISLAELPLMVLFATLSVAGPEPTPQQKPSFKMPPPAYFESIAELPVIAQLFTVRDRKSVV